MITDQSGSDDPEPATEPGATTPARTGSSARTWLLLTAGAVTVIAAVRMLGQPWPHFPVTLADSRSYVKVAKIGPFQGHFFFDERPILFPLLVWIVRNNSTAVVVAQSAIYVAAWWTLGRVVVRDLGVTPVSVAAIVLLAAVAIEPRNSLWNTLILTESLSTSLAVFSVAAWWNVATRGSPRTITLAWVLTALWVLVRDANVLPTMIVIVPAGLFTAFVLRRGDRSARRAFAAGGLALTLVCGYVYISESASGRTQNSIHNTVGDRVLTNPELLSYFTAAGMPLDAALREQANRDAWDANEAFQKAPQLARYRAWASGPGGRRLLESMVVLAPYWWRHLHHDLPTLLDDDKVLEQIYDANGVYKRLPHALPAPLGEPRTNAGLWVELTVALAALGVAATDARRRGVALVLAVGLLAAAVDVWISYAGDPLEIGRHLTGSFALLSVLAILAVAIGADVIGRRIRAGRASNNEVFGLGVGDDDRAG